MCYAKAPTPHNECSHSVLGRYTNTRKLKSEWKGNLDKRKGISEREVGCIREVMSIIYNQNIYFYENTTLKSIFFFKFKGYTCIKIFK